MLRALCLMAASLAALPVSAQNSARPAAPKPAVAASVAPEEAPFPSWDVRLGASLQDRTGPEKGVVNFTGEIVTPKLFSLTDRIAGAFVPRFHVGTSLNAQSTRFAYAGATWTAELTKQIFVEASLGAAINDGKTGALVPLDRVALGCNAGLRQAASAGVRLNDRWSLVATLEHLTNAGACDRNRGMSNFGARLGYAF
jgi:lipid A 3-O-deacylase